MEPFVSVASDVVFALGSPLDNNKSKVATVATRAKEQLE